MGCSETKKQPDQEVAPKATPSEKSGDPVHLYLPGEEVDPTVVDMGADEAPFADSVTFGPSRDPAPYAMPQGRCPADMVHVAGAFCVDRFEVSLVDAKAGRALSPHYPPIFDLTQNLYNRWSRDASKSRMSFGRMLATPEPPAFQLLENFAPRAQALRGQIPAGYLSRTTAESACKNAGKRLCSRGEWVRACRGERGTRFPYGESYQDGVCNVYRKSHPARLIHGNSSANHLDPRLGLAKDEDGPLLRSTGEMTECVSRWGADGIYDMVGNLDEWIEEPEGSFLGGFFSRATRDGCDSSIDSHAPGYLDYSLGTRCCLDPP